jgi:hypothetical protein
MGFEDVDLYGGIAGAELPVDAFDLGHGIALSRTYAHLMAPFMMAFTPAPPGKHHPAPWRAAKGGFGFDVVAQIHIPSNFSLPDWFDKLNTIWWLAALLRFKAAHSVTIPVVASEPFTKGRESNDIEFWPIEIDPHRLQMIIKPSIMLEDDLCWVRDHWIDAGRLLQRSKQFNLLFQSLDQSLFSRNKSLAFLSLWSALEATFSPARSELRFRISANIAAYLETPGSKRSALQKRIAKLYDARSAVAHGTSQREDAAFKNTYDLVCQVLMHILSENHVPTRDELEQMLFGIEDEEGPEASNKGMDSDQ